MAECFGVALPGKTVARRYNIAPSQEAAIIASTNPTEIVYGRWGLPIELDGRKKEIINARRESLLMNPDFAQLLPRWRCLVIADGFYEWKAAGKAKTPYRIERADGEPFGMAGIFRLGLVQGKVTPCFAVITVPASEPVGAIHNRMPVILGPEEGREWLRETDPKKLVELLRSSTEPFTIFPVSKGVNDPELDSPELIRPLR